jgi:hypothetical protein
MNDETTTQHEIGRPSHWIIRVMEWDDPKARYPNLWQAGMPRHVLAVDRLARRLRLGDLLAAFHPASARHVERADRFVGLSRVVGLRSAEQTGQAWVDLETLHRFDPPLDLGEAPRRVFMCCDPGWPEADVALFERVSSAARAGGWQPESDMVPGAAAEPASQAAPPSGTAPAATRSLPRVRIEGTATEGLGRSFAGAAFSGDMRDPRERTWLAQLELREERLLLLRLEATGRSGLQTYLRGSDRLLLRAEAIGLDFPFALPLPFAETLLEGPFPGEGWWALARRLEKLSRPDYLMALQDFREKHGEILRATDERAGAFSPLHRVSPDLGPMTYHGVRMIAEDRSRYAIRPFESAKGRLLLEVYPGALLRRLGLSVRDEAAREATVDALQALPQWSVAMDAEQRKRCVASPHAVDAVIAARSAAVAVLSGEAERRPEELSPEQGDRIRREGWIYGLEATT